MGERSSFYLTLSSDSSLRDYPDNRTSTFTVSLPKTISLQGEWEMALSEFHYPHTIQNVTKDNNKFIYQYKKMTHNDSAFRIFNVSVEIPIGHYRTVDDVIKVLNYAIEHHKDVRGVAKDMFSISSITGKVECNTAVRDAFVKHVDTRQGGNSSDIMISPHRLYLEGTLAIMMGFNPYENNLLVENLGEHLPNAKLGISSKIMLYCDIIEPQYIGHRQAQVLKTMTTLDPSVNYGDVCEKHFPTLQYVDVMATCFDSIHLDIRTTDGRLVPFGFGSSSALVHLRPKSNNEFIGRR